MNKRNALLIVSVAVLLLLLVFLAVMLLTRNNTQPNSENTTGSTQSATAGQTPTDFDEWGDEPGKQDETTLPAGTGASPNIDQETTSPELDVQVESTTDTTPETTVPVTDEQPKHLTYAEYIALSGQEQAAYFQSFADPAAYFQWYNQAKADYDNKEIHDIENGKVDLGDFMP